MIFRFFYLNLTIFVLLFGLSGCALTTDYVALTYTQQQSVTTIDGASNVKVNVQVIDQRQDKSKVGSKKNGYGMEMAPILATEDVAITISRAIGQELVARGFTLTADSSTILVNGEIIRFSNDFKMGFFAGDAITDLTIVVSVKSPKGEVQYFKNITAQGIEPNIQLATGENAKLALNRALENGIKILFEDQAFLSSLTKSSTTNIKK
jgi:uncharacterized lipoprotein